MVTGNCLSFTPHQMDLMRKAGRLTAMARAYGGSLVQPGITTRELDHEIGKFIKKHGGYPSFYHLYGFQGNACISINDEIIHGVPGNYRLKEGDIVSIDVGACIGDYRLDGNKAAVGGYHGDCCGTFACGEVSPEAKRIIEVTEQSFWQGFAAAKAGGRVHDISRAVQDYVEGNGYCLVRDYTGHGIGHTVHEAPEVPNYVPEHGRNERLIPGLALCVEPMVYEGPDTRDPKYPHDENGAGLRAKHMPDGWSVPMTRGGKLSAHYENTILITDGEAEILTRCEE